MASYPQRRFWPRGLLTRSILLLLLPFFLLQLLVILIFWFGHWQPLTSRLTAAVTNELDLLVTAFESQQFDLPFEALENRPEDLFVNLDALENLGIRAVSVRGPVNMALDQPLAFSTLDRQLRRRLTHLYPTRTFAVDIATRPNVALIFVAQGVDDGGGPRHYFFTVTRDRLFSEAGPNFLYLILILGALILLPSVLFLRNQVRPIRHLARDAAAFGRGESPEERPLRGAQEVRQAIAAFRDMRARIRRAVEQRTNMLAGVSHDLRTPLTRLKLQLALMEDGPDKDGLESDVAEMEAMLIGYLDYARGNVAEDDRLIILADLVRDVAAPHKWPGLKIQLAELNEVAIKGRKTALVRLINNLLANAQRHASAAWIGVERSKRTVILSVYDDGPGIEVEGRERALQPFQRLDEGRNMDDAGIGLGLTVCQDIARHHGGRLTLGDSAHGGLLVQMILPI